MVSSRTRGVSLRCSLSCPSPLPLSSETCLTSVARIIVLRNVRTVSLRDPVYCQTMIRTRLGQGKGPDGGRSTAIASRCPLLCRPVGHTCTQSVPVVRQISGLDQARLGADPSGRLLDPVSPRRVSPRYMLVFLGRCLIGLIHRGHSLKGSSLKEALCMTD